MTHIKQLSSPKLTSHTMPSSEKDLISHSETLFPITRDSHDFFCHIYTIPVAIPLKLDQLCPKLKAPDTWQTTSYPLYGSFSC